MAGIPNPSKGLTRFFGSPFAYDLPIATFALCAGYASHLTASRAGHKDAAGIWLTAAIGVFLFTVVKVAVQWRTAAAVESLEPLYGAMHVLHASLLRFADSDDIRVRVALYRSHDKDRLQQATSYVGELPGRITQGRYYSNRCGIIGSVFRKREVLAASFPESDHASFVNAMMTEWMFDEAEAKALTPDVRSWMAIPVKDVDGEDIIGVVYCDATVPHFFDDEERQRVAIHCALGIARFVGSRYKHVKAT